MVTGQHIAETALNSGLIGTPYSKLDCQALVEKVLFLAGLQIINYRGSNHMWRDLVYQREPIEDAVILPGMLAFIVKQDGGEKKRGYRDDMGNASHVAVTLGDGRVFESTTGGVQISSIKRFTHVARVIDVDYGEPEPNDYPLTISERIYQVCKLLEQARADLEVIRDDIYRNS